MPERVVIHQKSNFETHVQSRDPLMLESAELHAVKHIADLTPYGMLLSSLGSCTATVVHTYAQYHGLKLDEVELTIEYHRTFKEDCADCEKIDEYNEQITMGMSFLGDLSPQDREKLFKVSKQCPIHKMLKRGITVKSEVTNA
ncbi:MAG: OsmC family protein [Thermodesulfovibrionales bacterium]|jgi:putative redox protein